MHFYRHRETDFGLFQQLGIIKNGTGIESVPKTCLNSGHPKFQSPWVYSLNIGREHLLKASSIVNKTTLFRSRTLLDLYLFNHIRFGRCFYPLCRNWTNFRTCTTNKEAVTSPNRTFRIEISLHPESCRISERSINKTISRCQLPLNHGMFYSLDPKTPDLMTPRPAS